METVESLSSHHSVTETRARYIAFGKASNITTGLELREFLSSRLADVMQNTIIEDIALSDAIAQIKQPHLIIEVNFVQQTALQKIEIECPGIYVVRRRLVFLPATLLQ